MTEQPTFEYRDEDGDDLIARPMRGIPAVLILTGTNGIAVDLDRVEEVVAGIRDAARTAARQTTGQDDTDRYDARLTAPMTTEAAAALRDRIETGPLARRAVGQPAEAHGTEARPPRVQWRVEIYDPVAEEWAPGVAFSDRAIAAERLNAIDTYSPRWGTNTPPRRRLVRETTTWTVEGER
jgi:hypothetical protein